MEAYGREREAVSRRETGMVSSTMLARLSASSMLAAVALVGACAASQPSASATGAPGAAGTLEIRQFDVGQGDAALITTPTGRRILIDAGPAADDVARLLEQAGVDTIDLVIASHNHADHIGGMPRVLESFVVRAYVENGLPQPTAVYQRTLAALEREPGLRYLEATERTITLGTVRVRILGSPGVDRSQNNNSVGTVIEHGRFNALYTGDSELPALAAWLQLRRVPRVTMVKVAHHGSGNGTSADWVRSTAPAIALISVGGRNAHGHPAAQSELMWASVGARVLRTDQHGTITISADAAGRFVVRTTPSRASVR